jgi:hypothetical protein
MRRAARTDGNQGEIVAGLRQAGCSVLLLYQVGQGCPDLLVGTRKGCPECGREAAANFLLEVKDGSKPASARKLTPDEQVFFSSWRGQIEIASSIEDALRVVGRLA